jgi:hypothetical protein
VLVASIVAGSGPAARAGSDGGSGSLTQQVMRGAEQALGGQAPVAVARAYDRGYDGLQIVEGLLDANMTTEGVVSEDGTPLTPFHSPAGRIEGNGGRAADIALDALERGIQKTTKRLDRQYDLTARWARADVEDESMFTMMLVLAGALQGYTPDQILVDGLLGGGFRLTPSKATGIVIVDDKGKPIRPGVTEVSDEQEEAASTLEAFVVDAIDTIGGLDVRTAAATPYNKLVELELTVTAAIDDGFTMSIDGKGAAGRARGRALRDFVVGEGSGALEGSGACFITGGPKYPYTLDGNVGFGITGSSVPGTLTLRVGIVEANVSVTGSSETCVDILESTSALLETLVFPQVEVATKDGATASAETAIGGVSFDLTVTIRT